MENANNGPGMQDKYDEWGTIRALDRVLNTTTSTSKTHGPPLFLKPVGNCYFQSKWVSSFLKPAEHIHNIHFSNPRATSNFKANGPLPFLRYNSILRANGLLLFLRPRASSIIWNIGFQRHVEINWNDNPICIAKKLHEFIIINNFQINQLNLCPEFKLWWFSTYMHACIYTFIHRPICG